MPTRSLIVVATLLVACGRFEPSKKTKTSHHSADVASSSTSSSQPVTASAPAEHAVFRGNPAATCGNLTEVKPLGLTDAAAPGAKTQAYAIRIQFKQPLRLDAKFLLEADVASAAKDQPVDDGCRGNPYDTENFTLHMTWDPAVGTLADGITGRVFEPNVIKTSLKKSVDGQGLEAITLNVVTPLTVDFSARRTYLFKVRIDRGAEVLANAVPLPDGGPAGEIVIAL